MTLYGSDICPDCLEAKKTLADMGIKYEYVVITENTDNMKAFLHLRDTLPLFDEVRRDGCIGIPLFTDGERYSFDLNDFC